MSKFEYRSAIVCVSGDYCAWHETDLRCEYIYGTGAGDCWQLSDYFSENYENFSWFTPKPSIDIEAYWDILTPAEMDKLADEFINNWERDGGYSDYEVKNVLVEFNNEGEIKGTYLEI